MAMIWSPEAVARIAHSPLPATPLIEPASAAPILPGYDLWDLWPVQTVDGVVAPIAGGALFMILSAPAGEDPEARHALARIRLMHRSGDGTWVDLGPTLPDGFSPGSREWAGSAVLDNAGAVTLYFTAAGRRGEDVLSFEQRLFQTSARLVIDDGKPRLEDWSPPVECVVPDGTIYTRDMEGGGAIGTIKAFRDPGYFRDPLTERELLLFTSSLASSSSSFNGAIGAASRDENGNWSLLPPLITADGLNNELERPHIVVAKGRYYLFWSTQGKVFAPGGPIGPTGLYGAVADNLAGPWRPLNESGLVLANPPEAPHQAFSWLVTDDLEVFSFVDLLTLADRPTDPALARAHFGGTPAPVVHLDLDHDRSRLVS